jgi:hypothetical protein
MPLLAALLAGCAGFDRSGTADQLAKPAGMTRSLVRTSGFVLTAFTRSRDARAPWVVYIEGDGLAWLSRTEPSPDPTPRTPVGLQLAVLDPAPNVLYLARPCQYTPFEVDRRCHRDYWTGRRFAEEVVAAMNEAIDRVVRASGRAVPPVGGRETESPRGVRLVGYSGGGAVAALIAARRGDVIDLRTVAGNLDHVALNRHHEVSPLRGSLNAADVAPRLAGLPQLHLVGGRDKVVVPSVAESYAARAGDRRCIRIQRIDGATHEDGWTEIWPTILRRSPACGSGTEE